MRTPKMLPWLARKAGINDARAEALWAEALDYAATTPFEPRPGAGDDLAVKRLLMLIEAEAYAMRPSQEQSRQAPGPRPSSSPVAMKAKSENMLAAALAS